MSPRHVSLAVTVTSSKRNMCDGPNPCIDSFDSDGIRFSEGIMYHGRIVADIDAEIALLQQARNLLAGLESRTSSRRGSKNKMSAAGRARISAAQKARWAKFKKSKG